MQSEKNNNQRRHRRPTTKNPKIFKTNVRIEEVLISRERKKRKKKTFQKLFSDTARVYSWRTSYAYDTFTCAREYHLNARSICAENACENVPKRKRMHREDDERYRSTVANEGKVSRSKTEPNSHEANVFFFIYFYSQFTHGPPASCFRRITEKISLFLRICLNH